MKEKEFLNLEVYKKSLEIVELTKALVEAIPTGKDKLKIGNAMMANSYIIPAKIAGAEAVDIYSYKIENATLIKIAARELLAQTSLCKHMHLNYPDHLQLLRDEIENFRKLFLAWVNKFDKTNDHKDEWTIF